MSLEKHFDNLIKVIKVRIEGITIAKKTVEIDLELPRGYVAKFKDIFMELRIAGITGTIAIETVFAALIRDPDDEDTVQIPFNEVQHDAIMDIAPTVMYDTTTGFGYVVVVGANKHIKFHDDLFDGITARNMRFNANATVDTSFAITCTIYYTLEKIKSDLILELLDIL